jgi:hypothetical protein
MLFWDFISSFHIQNNVISTYPICKYPVRQQQTKICLRLASHACIVQELKKEEIRQIQRSVYLWLHNGKNRASSVNVYLFRIRKVRKEHESYYYKYSFRNLYRMRFISSGTYITIKDPKELVLYNISSFGTYYIIVELLFNDRRLVSSFNVILLYHTCHTILLLIIFSLKFISLYIFLSISFKR